MQLNRLIKRKAKFSVAILSWLLSASAGAYEYGYSDNYTNNWQYNVPNDLSCNECCDPCASGGFFNNIGIRADFLWWKPSTDGILYGRAADSTFIDTEVDPSLIVSDQTFFVTRNEFNFKFDPGFRVGLNYHSPCNHWDIALNWTHYNTKAKASGFAIIPEDPTAEEFTFFSTFWNAFGDNPDLATGHWKLDLDLIDLEFGYDYEFCSCFSLRPHAGLRAGRIDQKIRSFSESSRPLALSEGTPFTSNAHAKCEYWGIGPRVGFDAGLEMGWGLSLFGQGAGSILWGRNKNRSHDDFHGSILVNEVPEIVQETNAIYDERSSVNRSRFITDVAFGLKWDHKMNCCNREFPLSLAVMWEHHAFFDITNFNFVSNRDPNTGKPSANLYTQGVTVSLNVGF